MSVKSGDKVTLDYTGTLADGTVFDTSKHGDHSHPLEFTVGSGQVIPGFDKAVLGMEIGEEKQFKIPSEEAYGAYDEKLIQAIPKSQMPGPVSPGDVLAVQTPEGEQLPVTVKEVKGEEVILDMNHPLAGKELNFAIKLLKKE